MPKAPIVAVLAGGAGRRLGGDKALVPLGGQALISYPLQAAAKAGIEAIVVAKQASRLPPLSCELVLDAQETSHPLCGVIAALEHAGGRPVVTLACDMPFLAPSLIAWLAQQPTSAVVELDGRLQPLLARYEPTMMPVLAHALREGASAQSVLLRAGVPQVGERELARFGDPSRLCFNVNDSCDLELAEVLLDQG